jgi:hypothetical protein
VAQRARVEALPGESLLECGPDKTGSPSLRERRSTFRTEKGRGLLCDLSTYSSYALRRFALFAKGEWAMADLNILISNHLCFAGGKIGTFVTDRVEARLRVPSPVEVWNG